MKELIKTPFITALLAKAAGEDVDVNKLHVYEVRATSTVPFRGKSGTIFERGRISPHTIAQLAKAVNEDAVPLMMDHDLNGTPYGKFFYAEAIPMDNGDTELRGYMYVDGSEEVILAKLEAASIDEVSIQFKSEHMFCSECDFDYFAALAEDNFLPLMTHTCENDHEVGKNGTHVRLVGVDEVIELSLVSRGAAKNSKIMGASSAMLGESAQRLAASGVDLNDYMCTASINDDEGVSEVDLKELTTKLTALMDDKVELSTKLSTAEASATALTAERDAAVTRAEEAEAEVARLTAEAEAAAEAAETDQPELTEEQQTELKAYVDKQFVALKALDGETDATAPESMADTVIFITENATRLSSLIPVDGVTAAAGKGNDKSEAPSERQIASLSAFKSK